MSSQRIAELEDKVKALEEHVKSVDKKMAFLLAKIDKVEKKTSDDVAPVTSQALARVENQVAAILQRDVIPRIKMIERREELNNVDESLINGYRARVMGQHKTGDPKTDFQQSTFAFDEGY